MKKLIFILPFLFVSIVTFGQNNRVVAINGVFDFLQAYRTSLITVSSNTFFTKDILSDGNGTSRFGTGAGKVNSAITGVKNTFIGDSAGFNNMAGAYNVYLGHQAGYSNVRGVRNTAIGMGALYSNDNSIGNNNNNTAIGYQAGYLNVGFNNVFLGHISGYYETGSNTWMFSNGNGSTNLANSRTHAWMWGTQNADSSTNTAYINASTTINKDLTVQRNLAVSGTSTFMKGINFWTGTYTFTTLLSSGAVSTDSITIKGIDATEAQVLLNEKVMKLCVWQTSANANKIGYVRTTRLLTGDSVRFNICGVAFAVGDKNFRFATYEEPKKLTWFIPGVLDTSSYQDVVLRYWVEDGQTWQFLCSSAYVETPGVGANPALKYNIYSGGTNADFTTGRLYSSNISLSTNASITNRIPTVNTGTTGQKITIRIFNNEFGTSKASGLKVNLYYTCQKYLSIPMP